MFQIIAIGMVLGIEALNTAVEEIADFVHPDFHNKIGFIKDIPLNERRNFALGMGLGYGRHTYYQNLKITKLNDALAQFDVADGFKSNKFSMHTIELPLELRWRTSTIDKYKFYRIYFGGKISYAFATNSKFKGNSTIKVNGIDEINKLQYGLSLSMGYGTWNLNIYYGLSDLFSDAKLNETSPLKIRDFRVGLIFYILYY